MSESSVQIVVVQNPSPLFCGAVASLGARSGHFVSNRVLDLQAVLSACESQGAAVAVLEYVAGAYWQSVLSQLRNLDVRVVVTTQYRGQPIKLDPSVLVLERTCGSDEMLAAILDDTSLLSGFRESGARPEVGRLTTREVQVLSLIAAGSTTLGVAQRLGIGRKTVESRLQSAFAKLGAQSQAQAVSLALRAGFLGGGLVSSTQSRARTRRNYGEPTFRTHSPTPGVASVIVAHDHRWIAQLVEEVTEGVAEVVGVSESAAIAVNLSEVFKPDVVVVSEMLSDGLIDSYLGRLLRTGARLVLVGLPEDLQRSLDLVEQGISGLVRLSISPDVLRHVIVGVAQGNEVYPPDLMEAIMREWRTTRRGGTGRGKLGSLTPRESEILEAMVTGMPAKAIARLLGVTLKTVENHKTRIFGKLGVRTQAAAVSLMIEAGRHVAHESALLEFQSTHVNAK